MASGSISKIRNEHFKTVAILPILQYNHEKGGCAMASNKSTRLHVDFKSKWMGSAAFFGGLCFFLLCVFYFGFTNLIDLNIIQILLYMLLPMVVMAALVVLLHVLHHDSVMLILALGGVYSLLMLFWSLSYGNIINLIAGIVWYALTALICLLMITGALSDKGYLVIAFIAPVLVRLVVIVFQCVLTLSLTKFVREIAAVCGLVAFGLTALCFVPIKRKTE